MYLLLACAPPDRDPEPRRSAEEVQEQAAGADSGAIEDSASGDTGPSADTGPLETPCGSGLQGPDDALPLRLADAVAEGEEHYYASLWFGTMVAPAMDSGLPGVWIGGHSLLDPTADSWAGTRLVDATHWATGDPEGGVRITEEDSHGGMVASGVTSDPAFAGEATFWGTFERTGGAWWMRVVGGTPSGDLDLSDSGAAVEGSGPADGWQVLDMDGDGIDDVLFDGLPANAFLGPWNGVRSAEDSDLVFPAEFASAGLEFHPYRPAAADLDGDGYSDLAWFAGETQRGGFAQQDVQVLAGPLVNRLSDWPAAPDGTVADTASDLTELAYGVNNYWNDPRRIRAVGDVTGDGKDDITASFNYGGEQGAEGKALFVLDRLPGGAIDLLDLPRVIGVASEVFGDVSSGGSGDFDGDGFLDLLAFHWSVVNGESNAHRAYVVPGPVSGESRLAEAAVPLEIPCADSACMTAFTVAQAVPDLDGDGRDEVLLSTEEQKPDQPGTVWLFPGCPDW